MTTQENSTLLIALTTAAAGVLLFGASRRAARAKNDAKQQTRAKRTQNEMFIRFALSPEKVTLSTTGKQVTVPYHVYDGWASSVYGTCNLSAAKNICESEGFQPIETVSGKALCLISFWDFVEANAGPHTEFQFTLLVSSKSIGDAVVVKDSPFASFKAISSDPRIHFLITELYNNTETVVAYNNEIFALNAILSETDYKRDAGQFTVVEKMGTSETDIENNIVIRANLGKDRGKNDLSAVFSMLWDVGYSKFAKLMALPYSTTYMTSRCHDPRVKSCLAPTNVTALAFTKAATIWTQYFDPSRHSLQIGPASHTLRHVDFVPETIFHLDGVEFCYTCPIDIPRTTLRRT